MSDADSWPPRFAESKPCEYTITPTGSTIAWLLGEGWRVEIGYEDDSALMTTLYAATESRAIRKARRFIASERRRIAADEAKLAPTSRRHDFWPWHEDDCRAPRRPCVCPAYHAE